MNGKTAKIIRKGVLGTNLKADGVKILTVKQAKRAWVQMNSKQRARMRSHYRWVGTYV